MQRKLVDKAIKLQPRFLACRGIWTDSNSVGRTPDPKIPNEDHPADVSDPRPNSNSSTQARNEDIICVGFDGSPFPADEKESGRNRRDEEEEDDKEYFKASPLSELEIADTRKPVTKATDGTAGDYGGGGVVVWRPEQIDTAEDSLRRATEIWKQSAMRGDPESPHGKVLRSMRGEYW